MIPVYSHRGVVGLRFGHDGEDPSVLMGKTRGAPSNEWTGRQAFRAAQPSGDSGSLRRVPRGSLPHHEPAPELTHEYPDLDPDYPLHKAGRFIAAHPLVTPPRRLPAMEETWPALRADLTPAAPSWPTSRELAHAYCEGHK